MVNGCVSQLYAKDAESEQGVACCLQCRKSYPSETSVGGERTLGRKDGLEEEDSVVDSVSGRDTVSLGMKRCREKSHVESSSCQREADRGDNAVV